jgi:DNA-binding response OmpR family regulator
VYPDLILLDQHLLDAGAGAYLTKPLDVRKLLALLDETAPRRGG